MRQYETSELEMDSNFELIDYYIDGQITPLTMEEEDIDSVKLLFDEDSIDDGPHSPHEIDCQLYPY